MNLFKLSNNEAKIAVRILETGPKKYYFEMWKFNLNELPKDKNFR